MHSSIVRVQNVFGFFTSVAFFIGLVVAFSTLLFPSSPTASVSVRDVKVRTGRPHYHSTKSQEIATISFDLDADLTSLFNYNTKQVFAYLSLSYNGPSPSDVSTSSKWAENDAVIWDAIIPSASKAKIHLKKKQAKYKITDISGKFHERNATLRLAWNVQPHVGALYWGQIEAPVDVMAKKDLNDAEKGMAGGYGSPDKWQLSFPPAWGKKKGTTQTAA